MLLTSNWGYRKCIRTINRHTNCIRTHFLYKLRSCKDYSVTAAIVLSNCAKFLHLSWVKISQRYIICNRHIAVLSCCDKCLKKLSIDSLLETIKKKLEWLNKVFRTIKSSLEVDVCSSAICLSAYFEGVNIKSECLVYTCKTYFCNESLCTSTTTLYNK